MPGVMDEVPGTGQKGVTGGTEEIGIGCRSAADQIPQQKRRCHAMRYAPFVKAGGDIPIRLCGRIRPDIRNRIRSDAVLG